VYLGNPYRFLYPRDRSYFVFNGSLAAPPCSPAIWVVFATPVPISAQQLELFRSSLNATQPQWLRYAPSEQPPLGVSCASGCPGLNYTWSTGLGMNARERQAMGNRWVRHVQMVTPRSAASVEAASGYGWQWYLASLVVMLLAACAIGTAMRDARAARGASSRAQRAERDDKASEAYASQELSTPQESPQPLHSAQRQAAGALPYQQAFPPPYQQGLPPPYQPSPAPLYQQGFVPAYQLSGASPYQQAGAFPEQQSMALLYPEGAMPLPGYARRPPGH